MTPEYAKIRRHLSRRDPVMKELVRAVGCCTLAHDPDHFPVLVRSIVAQLISTKAARTITGRLFETLKHRVEPRQVLKTPAEQLRAVGLSGGKVLALRDLAEKCVSGAVPLDRLATMPDDDILRALVAVRGIGVWTAEMFLIFSLGRLDVLPVGDYGLRAGVMKHYRLDELPKKDALVRLTAPWAPYRSIGTWYIWRAAGFVPQSNMDAEPPAPREEPGRRAKKE